MADIVQRSFAGGEIAPALYGRVDQVKYQTGVRRLRNFYVRKWGGASNRPGTKFVAEVKDSTKTVVFIDFQFNDDQTYALEFGNLYMRVHQNGAQLTEGAVVVDNASNTNPVVITKTSHGYSDGDELYLANFTGMTELNNRNVRVSNATVNTFEILDMNGNPIDGTGYGAFAGGGTVDKVYEIVTPYLEADLLDLKFVQSADVITITHASYETRDLSRTGHTSWTLSVVNFRPTIDRPTNGAGAAGGAGTKQFHYRVTAIAENTLEESLTGYEVSQAITNVTEANPAVVTITGHGYDNGDELYIDNIVGMTELNAENYIIDNVTANTFELVGIDSTTFTPYSSGGTAERTAIVIDSAADPSATAPHVLSWNPVTDALEYNVYKRDINGLYGLIGTASGEVFSDTNYSPNSSFLPPIDYSPFDDAGNYPSVVAYYQLRRIYANTTNNPETVFGSRVANYNNMTYSTPTVSSDAWEFTLAGRKVNRIQHMVDLKGLLLFTSAAVYQVLGDSDRVIRPGQFNPVKENSFGASSVQPVELGNAVLYVQNRGSILRDLRYEFSANGYNGRDLSIFANHLFKNHLIVDMAYAEIPDSVVYLVRDDGKMLALTYVPEHEIWGFSLLETDGSYERVTTIPEGDADAVYVVVKREIEGYTKRYIEQFYSREVTDVAVDAYFLDSGLSYDGRNTNDSHSMTLSGGVTWDNTEELTLTSSLNHWETSSVGKEFLINDVDPDTSEVVGVIRLTITQYVSPTEVKAKSDRTVPDSLRNTATTNWSDMADTVTGAWHLEGQTISALCDGNVVSNVTVAQGAAGVGNYYSIIHVGKPYSALLETLDIDLTDSESIVPKKKKISNLTLLVESTRGIFVGSDENHLYEHKQRKNESYDSPIGLFTGEVEMNITSDFETGRFVTKQNDPLPITVLSAIPNLEIGG